MCSSDLRRVNFYRLVNRAGLLGVHSQLTRDLQATGQNEREKEERDLNSRFQFSVKSANLM